MFILSSIQKNYFVKEKAKTTEFRVESNERFLQKINKEKGKEMTKLKLMTISCIALMLSLAISLTTHARAEKSTSIKSPPYIVSHKGNPRMRFAVLNRTTMVSCELLKRVLKVVAKQATCDFSPYYGIDAEFVVFKDGEQPHNWENFVPLILVDLLLPTANFSGISLHGIQSFAVQNPATLWANAIDTYISNPPIIPDGLPYIIVPMGTATSGYGVFFYSTLGLPFLPPTFEGTLSEAISHETLETLWDPTVNLWTTNFGPTDSPINYKLYINEVCDPVQFANYQSKECPQLYLSNFVLPSYWNPYGLSFAPFDFLNTVTAPLTPFAGQQLYIFTDTNPCTVEFFTSFSSPSDPSTIIIFDQGPVLTPHLAATRLNEKQTRQRIHTGFLTTSNWKNLLNNK